MREAVPFEQNFYNGSDISHGLTLLEFIASRTGYGNCADCQITQEFLAEGEQLFAKSLKEKESMHGPF